MEYAVIETGGKQYKVKENDVLDVENLDLEEKAKVDFTKVLLYVKEENVEIGKPYIDKFSVEASVISKIRGKKIRVARFRAKSRHRRVYGHRQALTKVKILKIGDSKKESQEVKKESKSEK